MDEEKRHHFRWRKNIRITYSFADSEQYREAFTEDISESGVQILANDKFELGQEIRLKLEFVHDSVPVVVSAKVVFVESHEGRFRTGLKFLSMNEFDKHRFERFLEKIRYDF